VPAGTRRIKEDKIDSHFHGKDRYMEGHNSLCPYNPVITNKSKIIIKLFTTHCVYALLLIISI